MYLEWMTLLEIKKLESDMCFGLSRICVLDRWHGMARRYCAYSTFWSGLPAEHWQSYLLFWVCGTSDRPQSINHEYKKLFSSSSKQKNLFRGDRASVTIKVYSPWVQTKRHWAKCAQSRSRYIASESDVEIPPSVSQLDYGNSLTSCQLGALSYQWVMLTIKKLSLNRMCAF